jgi:hypothetical protein
LKTCFTLLWICLKIGNTSKYGSFTEKTDEWLYNHENLMVPCGTYGTLFSDHSFLSLFEYVEVLSERWNWTRLALQREELMKSLGS